MTRVRSSLASAAGACRDPDPAKARAAAKEAWHLHGIILISPGWFNAWTDQKQAELLAEKLFGKRKAHR